MDTSPYDEVDMSYNLEADQSPVDGSTSGGEQDDQLKPLDGHMGQGVSNGHNAASSMNIIGKPMGTNNFVTKLYQCVFLLLSLSPSSSDHSSRPRLCLNHSG